MAASRAETGQGCQNVSSCGANRGPTFMNTQSTTSAEKGEISGETEKEKKKGRKGPGETGIEFMGSIEHRSKFLGSGYKRLPKSCCGGRNRRRVGKRKQKRWSSPGGELAGYDCNFLREKRYHESKASWKGQKKQETAPLLSETEILILETLRSRKERGAESNIKRGYLSGRAKEN